MDDIKIVVTDADKSPDHHGDGMGKGKGKGKGKGNTVTAASDDCLKTADGRKPHYKLAAHLIDIGRSTISKYYRLSLATVADCIVRGHVESALDNPEDHILFVDQSVHCITAVPSMPQLLIVGLDNGGTVSRSSDSQLQMAVKSQYLSAIKNIGDADHRLGILVLSGDTLMSSYWVLALLSSVLLPLRQTETAQSLTSKMVVPKLRIVIYSKIDRNAEAVRQQIEWLVRAKTKSPSEISELKSSSSSSSPPPSNLSLHDTSSTPPNKSDL
jgi:hypothetical protein